MFERPQGQSEISAAAVGEIYKSILFFTLSFQCFTAKILIVSV